MDVQVCLHCVQCVYHHNNMIWYLTLCKGLTEATFTSDVSVAQLLAVQSGFDYQKTQILIKLHTLNALQVIWDKSICI